MTQKVPDFLHFRTEDEVPLGTRGEALPRDEALHQNAALFAKIIDQAPGGVYVIDDQFRTQQVNALARPEFSAAEPVIGRDFGEVMRILWGPEVGGKIADIFRHTLTTGERYVSPPFTEHRYDQGVRKSYDWETQRLMLPNGKCGVVCYFSDTTTQRALEAALRVSEQRAIEIVQSIADGFVTMDTDWRVTYLSPRGGEILRPLRNTDSDVLGKVLWEEFPGMEPTGVLENCLRSFQEQKPAQFEVSCPLLNCWFDIRAYPSPSGLSLYFLDITERRQAEEALRASQQVLAEQAAALRKADRAKDEFLAMLAHELRNPLAPLRNATEILRDPGASADERAQAQSILGRQIENMSRMIDDLLDVSRITEGKIELRKEPVSVEAILVSAASFARSSCAAHRQELTVSPPPHPTYIYADSTRLEQVVGNLLGNACKYSGEGSHISLSAEQAPEEGRHEVLIRVRDDGAGIEPDLLPHVFDLFVQASRNLDRAHGGLGIGLTLVQRLVRLHGGSVEARSEGLGHGAEFIVRLPIFQGTPPPAPAPHANPATAEVGRRILIVDDNIDSTRSLALIQNRRGHQTRTAFTGLDALAIAAEFQPEVILLDIGLPGMDGFEVARKIREIPGLERAFLVAMTGYGSDGDRTTARIAGFDEYLIKPADLDVLRGWLKDLKSPAIQ